MAENGLVMYHVEDDNKRIQLEVLCMGMALRSKQLRASDLNEQVGVLAGIKRAGSLDKQAAEKAPVIFCMPDVIIFSGVPDKTLDEFLHSYKNLGLAPIKLKAVTTPKNAEWTLYHMIRELAEECRQLEAAAMRKQNNHGNGDKNVH